MRRSPEGCEARDLEDSVPFVRSRHRANQPPASHLPLCHPHLLLCLVSVVPREQFLIPETPHPRYV